MKRILIVLGLLLIWVLPVQVQGHPQPTWSAQCIIGHSTNKSLYQSKELTTPFSLACSSCQPIVAQTDIIKQSSTKSSPFHSYDQQLICAFVLPEDPVPIQSI